METGAKHHTTDEDINDRITPSPHAQYDQPSPPPHIAAWPAPPGSHPTLRRNRRVGVSIDTKTLPMQGEAARYDEEGLAAPGTYRLGSSNQEACTN